MPQLGRMGMTKALKRAQHLQQMQGNRKRDKRNQRASYHSMFKRKPGFRGYPRGQHTSNKEIGFLSPK